MKVELSIIKDSDNSYPKGGLCFEEGFDDLVRIIIEDRILCVEKKEFIKLLTMFN